MKNNDGHPLISAVSIYNLFGRRSYEIVTPEISGRPSRLLLLHGDNGSGKTTLLRLIWHALSAAENKGHRTFIGNTPFSELHIEMFGGKKITIKKPESLVGRFSLTVSEPGERDLVVNYRPSGDKKFQGPSITDVYSSHDDFVLLDSPHSLSKNPGVRDRLLEDYKRYEKEIAAQNAYFIFLKEEVKTPLYLADDRSLYSDDPDITRMRELLGRREDTERTDLLARLTFNELRITIRRVNDHLRSLMIGGQNDGSANSNAIYMNVLRQLVEKKDNHHNGTHIPIATLLNEVAKDSPKYEKYGLVPKLDTYELKRLLELASPELSELTDRIVSPFLSSLRARYDALSEAQELLDSLVPTVNSFLKEKELRFSPQSGLQIFTSDEEKLQLDSLSSGERQLLMLLCTTLLAGIDANLFLIDEPELSLGVEWQRKILNSLMGVTERSNLQFLIATHSIEIISTHPEALVQLRPL